VIEALRAVKADRTLWFIVRSVAEVAGSNADSLPFIYRNAVDNIRNFHIVQN
jgi:hypothetical protein